MADDSPDSSSQGSPNKRLKTISNKHKSKVEEETLDPRYECVESQRQSSMEDSCSTSCGICLSDGGKLIRGQIDSCDHYFCFVCIMEWAKVESRCPMCKRRFSTIIRPPKEGVFLSQRVVDVPQRDQVYHHFGNATTGVFDPFAHVQCGVCLSITDDSLLLLCDLCDSAAHTYCVGLGHTVPEGDWFCHDCAVTRAQHEQAEMDADSCNRYISGNSSVTSQDESHVHEHVRESSIVLEGYTPRISLPSNPLSPHDIRGGRTCIANKVTMQGTQDNKQIVNEAIESRARTLRRCRNVHSRIRDIRDNWDALRNGSMRFSSKSVESSANINTNHIPSTLILERSGQSNSSTSPNQDATARGDVSGLTGHKKELNDIDKAWKKMDIAKSMKSNRKSSDYFRFASEIPSNNDMLKQASTSSSSLYMLERERLGKRSNTKMSQTEKDWKYCSQEKVDEKYRSLKLEKQKQSRVTIVESLGRQSPVLYESPLTKTIKGPSDLPCPKSLIKDTFRVPPDKTYEEGGSSCLITSIESGLGPFDSFKAKPKHIVSSLLNSNVSKGNLRSEKSLPGSKKRKDDNAKSEIQSLVKLNLKLLNKDTILGVDAFKEIARLSTHTILAACGLGHPTPYSHSFQSSICRHTVEIQQLRKSTLMPNSCRECFYEFVKNVAHFIMSEKVGPG